MTHYKNKDTIMARSNRHYTDGDIVDKPTVCKKQLASDIESYLSKGGTISPVDHVGIAASAIYLPTIKAAKLIGVSHQVLAMAVTTGSLYGRTTPEYRYVRGALHFNKAGLLIWMAGRKPGSPGRSLPAN